MQVARRNNLGRVGFGRFAARAANMLGSYAGRSLRSFAINRARGIGRSGKSQRGEPQGGLAVTQYSQVADTYRKRRGFRGGRRFKKRSRRFFRKVNRAIDNRFGDNVLLRNFDTTVTATPTNYATGQKWLAWNMCGYESTGSQFVGDMYELFNVSNNINSGLSNKKCIELKSWVNDFSILNTHATLGCYVDIYYFKCKKNSLYSADAMMDQALGNTNSASAGSHITAKEQFGVTPFMCPEWCRAYTVVKTRRIVLSPGQQYNEIIKRKMSKKLHANYYLDAINGMSQGTFPGLTEGILLSVYGVGIASASVPDPFQIQVQVTKTYNACATDYAYDSNATI